MKRPAPLPVLAPSLLAAALLFTAACGTPRTTVATDDSPGGTAHASPVLPPTAYTTTDTVVTVHDLDEAKAIASATDRRILMVFAGSDWCAPCKMFKRSILDDEGFKADGRDDFVVLYLDFPSKKRNQLPAAQKAHNDALAEEYNPQGVFPRLYLLDARGETIREVKFAGQDAESFLTELSAG